ncbi:MAG: DUF2344 domain-containing protein, partial [Clostridia bacterium]|nr:DUF2344 domain-containing protein [Clostridia bacterium]
RYSKTDGAEFISHLDILRNFSRTFNRAEIEVKYSAGFHPHMLVYMSAPIGVGIKSFSEYCVIDTEESPESFKEKFNRYSQKGIKCLGAWTVGGKMGVASDIVKAQYYIKGINDFDENEVLNESEFIILNRDGKEKNVRDLIYEIKRAEGGLRCIIGFSNGLRAEKFAEKLLEKYGGKDLDITKEEAMTENGQPFERAIEE